MKAYTCACVQAFESEDLEGAADSYKVGEEHIS